MSQKERVLRLLQKGESITPLQAMKYYGAMRLAAIIHTLRSEGHKIATNIKRDPANGAPYAKYKLSATA